MVFCRFQTKSCIVLVGLVILVAVVSFVFVYTQNSPNGEIPDPEFALPPSSMPMGSYSNVGVVSNGGPCAQIGVDVMARGGNAVDAAIATLLCDGVLCPEYMGIGGGFMMSIYNATTKKVMTINARETAPAAATSEMFVKDPKKSMLGGLAVAIPGELKGYSTIYKLYGGKVSWESLFEPTIKLCENGIKISERLALNMRNHEELIKNDPFLREALFDEKTGHVKKVGEEYKLPKLAETMKIISVEGADAIYNGSLTYQLVEDLKKVNSIITEEDLANYEVEVEESFSVDLKSGHTIHVGPPPGSGVILAYILRILDGILPAPNSGLDAHRLVEAFKFGYGERTHLGDHNFVNVSKIYEKITSDSYIESIRNKISDNFTSLDPKYYGADFDMPENHGTANIVVTDSLGNTVVGTSTLNIYFGCGFVSPSTGITLNNEMDDFSTPGVTNYYGIPSSPANFIEPGKRPMSSMCPTIITDKNGDFVLGAGAAGGSKITLATAYVSALKLWYNMTLKEVIDKPRIYHQLVPMEVQYEYGTTKSVVQKLKDIGHPVTRLQNTIGSAATAIAKSPSGMIETMPDFRRPGNSSGY
ncbi:gamma-glutamyltranspeptidase 1-like isoform X2 [Myzus persicae]|uniref:gamma-glutamyltranspeptidase 1-like isoform X2 n=1 Tax=Myzus persicae TaxID=13164 RepID=UPI000B930FE1|nr:gamma-glutamyltranspeptidase 1-like isoform X2 [Myzus persicae]XP_022182528.1 gamma-glutamyltranspeptidase 1-like isoform X2 [Myzus persicae]